MQFVSFVNTSNVLLFIEFYYFESGVDVGSSVIKQNRKVSLNDKPVEVAMHLRHYFDTPQERPWEHTKSLPA